MSENTKLWIAVIAGISILCASVFASVYTVATGVYQGYSSGFRTGIIQKASVKGLFCKSTEGELVLDSFGSKATRVQGGGQIANTWAFSAGNPDVREDLEKLSGKNVKVTYKQWFIKPWCLDTDYEAIKVEEVK